MTLPFPRTALQAVRPYQAASGVGARHNLSANESFLAFDTSVIPDDAIIDSGPFRTPSVATIGPWRVILPLRSRSSSQ